MWSYRGKTRVGLSEWKKFLLWIVYISSLDSVVAGRVITFFHWNLHFLSSQINPHRLQFFSRWNRSIRKYTFFMLNFYYSKAIGEQESPPAWTQEAYRPPCSEYSCPVRGGYLTGYPPGGYPDPPGGVPGPLPRGYPDPPGGVPGPPWVPDRVPPRGGLGTPQGGYLTGPPTASWHSGKCCKALWDMGTPPVDRQIDGWTDACQNITFPRTTYAGGNNRSLKFGSHVFFQTQRLPLHPSHPFEPFTLFTPLCTPSHQRATWWNVHCLILLTF